MKSRLSLHCAAMALVVLALVAADASATPPKTLNYQGFLTSPADAPVDGAVQMTFSIYAAPTGGAALWSETQPSVTVAKGEFSTVLGLVTPLTLPFDVPYYMGVTVASDPEMTPRQALASSAYAFRASTLDSGATLPGAVLTGSIPTATLPGTQVTGSITAATIPGSQVEGPITAATIDGAQVTGSITTATIPGSNVTGDLSGASNIVLPDSTASVGNVIKNGIPFLHNIGTHNTFLGAPSGNLTMTGANNTAVGSRSLPANTTGNGNSALGVEALFLNTTGLANVAVGADAMFSNTSGTGNVAVGNGALTNNSNGSSNTALGTGALSTNGSGSNSTAIGDDALNKATGASNLGVGALAGFNVTTGSNNIEIANNGSAADNGVIRIGTVQTSAFIAGINGVMTGGTAVAVVVDGSGQLGTLSSSRSVKEDIADMGDASALLMKLRPVTFHYRNRPGWPLQFGLIAEEVAEVAPDLAARGPDGKIQTVYYQDLPPMLLNEYQKQQRVIEEQRARIEAEHARVDALERELAALKAKLGLD